MLEWFSLRGVHWLVRKNRRVTHFFWPGLGLHYVLDFLLFLLEIVGHTSLSIYLKRAELREEIYPQTGRAERRDLSFPTFSRYDVELKPSLCTYLMQHMHQRMSDAVKRSALLPGSASTSSPALLVRPPRLC